MKRKTLLNTLSILSICTVGVLNLNYSSNPPIDRTNRTGVNCTGCHSGSLNPTGGSLSISGTNAYYPGRTYTITAALTGGTIYGFEITAVQSSSTSTGAGTFSGTGFNTTTSGGRPYARHSLANTTSSFGVSWKAPTTNVGSVTIFGAGVSANNNGGTSGDKTYATTKVITALNKISFNLDSTSISCIGTNTGKLKVASVSGGAGGPYTYQWSGSTSTADSLVNLGQGSYSVTVTDSDNNSESLTVKLSDPPSITARVQSNSSLCGDSTGIATVSASGGTGPLSIIWPSNFTVSNDSALQLKAGNYTVTVQDSLGCSTTQNFSINTQGSNIAFDTSTAPETCDNGWGEAMVSNVRNTIGNFTYQWSNGSTNAQIDSLTGGSYTVTISDGAGCTATKTLVVGKTTNVLSFSTISSNDACNKAIGSAKAIGATGGKAPYSYNWSNGQNTDSISGLIKGMYSVTVTDSLGCTANQSINIDDESAPAISLSSSNLSCFNDSSGTAMVRINGGTKPYTYLWSNGSTDSTNSNLSANRTYTVTITDSNNCSTIDSVLLSEPAALLVDSLFQFNSNSDSTCDESAALIVSGGTPAYSFLWNNGAVDSALTDLCAGQYSVTVTDANGCMLSDSLLIEDASIASIADYQSTDYSIYPNPVLHSIQIDGTTPIVEVKVHSLQGKLLLSRSDSDIQFIDVEELVSGTYLLILTDDSNEQYISRFIKK